MQVMLYLLFGQLIADIRNIGVDNKKWILSHRPTQDLMAFAEIPYMKRSKEQWLARDTLLQSLTEYDMSNMPDKALCGLTNKSSGDAVAGPDTGG